MHRFLGWFVCFCLATQSSWAVEPFTADKTRVYHQKLEAYFDRIDQFRSRRRYIKCRADLVRLVGDEPPFVQRQEFVLAHEPSHDRTLWTTASGIEGRVSQSGRLITYYLFHDGDRLLHRAGDPHPHRTFNTYEVDVDGTLMGTEGRRPAIATREAQPLVQAGYRVSRLFWDAEARSRQRDWLTRDHLLSSATYDDAGNIIAVYTFSTVESAGRGSRWQILFRKSAGYLPSELRFYRTISAQHDEYLVEHSITTWGSARGLTVPATMEVNQFWPQRGGKGGIGRSDQIDIVFDYLFGPDCPDDKILDPDEPGDWKMGVEALIANSKLKLEIKK